MVYKVFPGSKGGTFNSIWYPEEMAKGKSMKRGKTQTNLLVSILKRNILTLEIIQFTTSNGPTFSPPLTF